MGYVIGSLNTCHFTGNGQHDIGALANIILTERFDIVALQEVFKPEAVDLLKKRLPGWNGCHGRPGNGRAADFGFAFLWNTRRVRECSKDGQPIIFNQYHSTMRLKRDPFYGRFTPSGLLGGAFFEIRLINVHLWWGSQGEPADIMQRREEFRLITNDIYRSISNHRYGDNMPAYTIVLGDYNLCAVICQYCENTTITHFAGTVQKEKTTISSNNDSYANDYDHFSYNSERFFGTDVVIERVDSVSKYMGGDYEKHKKDVSDHAPIRLELTLNTRRG